jgi:hypothetical protein
VLGHDLDRAGAAVPNVSRMIRISSSVKTSNQRRMIGSVLRWTTRPREHGLHKPMLSS